MKSLLPLILYGLNFYVGAQVAGGHVQVACQNDVINSFIDLGGYLLMGGTAIVSLAHAFKKTPVTTPTSPVATNTQGTATLPSAVSQPNFSQNTPPTPGTPLS